MRHLFTMPLVSAACRAAAPRGVNLAKALAGLRKRKMAASPGLEPTGITILARSILGDVHNRRLASSVVENRHANHIRNGLIAITGKGMALAPLPCHSTNLRQVHWHHAAPRTATGTASLSTFGAAVGPSSLRFDLVRLVRGD